MKKGLLLYLMLFVALGWADFSNASMAEEVALSDPIIIIEPGSSLLIKLPEVNEYIEVTSTRPFPSEAEIDPDNATPFQVLCPDWSIIKMPSDNTIFECPEIPTPEIVIQSEEPWPVVAEFWPTPVPLLPQKVPNEVDSRYDKAIQQLEKNPLIESNLVLKRLLCSLYRNANRRDEAFICYSEAMELSQQVGDKAGEAIAQYQSAFMLWQEEQSDSSIQWTQKALELNPQRWEPKNFLKFEDFFQRESQDPERSPEQQAFAHHHLVLLYHYVFKNNKEANQHAQKALEIYETTGLSDMADQLRELVKR